MSTALVQRAPDKNPRDQALPARTKAAATALAEATRRAQKVWNDREREARSLGDIRGREIDAAADNAWYALRDAIDRWKRFDPARYPKAAEANRLEWDLVGEEGWAFLRLPHMDQYHHMSMLLLRIKEDGLDRRINDLFGPEVLTEIERTFEPYHLYQEAEVDAEEARAGFREAAEDLRRAAILYVHKVVAEVDDLESEVEGAWLERALAPIPRMSARIRELYGARRAAEDDETADLVSEDDEDPPESTSMAAVTGAVPSTNAEPSSDASQPSPSA